MQAAHNYKGFTWAGRALYVAEYLIFITGNYYTTKFYTEIAAVRIVRKVISI